MRVIVKKLKECETGKNPNGYFKVSEEWNKMYFRWWHTEKDEIQVRKSTEYDKSPTYAKIPEKYKDRIFFVYASTESGILLEIGKNDLVCGACKRIKASGKNRFAFLIYCEKAVPCVSGNSDSAGILIKRPDEEEKIEFYIESLVPQGLFVRSYIPRLYQSGEAPAEAEEAPAITRRRRRTCKNQENAVQ